MKETNWKTENTNDWKKILSDIFGSMVPEHKEWTDIDGIVEVLNKIGQVDNSNHMFFPDGGGLDLTGATRSNDRAVIDLHTGVDYQVKPVKLTFERIDDDFEWSYFRLETAGLKPSGLYKGLGEAYAEEVVEYETGTFIPRHHWDSGEFEGEPLPNSARPLVRYFRGALVIFKKSSIYNSNSSTYDGRHEKLGAEGFKKHLQDVQKTSGEHPGMIILPESHFSSHD